MNFMKLISLVLVLAITAQAEEKKSYNGYRLLRLTPTTEAHLEQITNWETNDNDFDVWVRPRGVNHPVDVALGPKSFEVYKIAFISSGILYSIVQNNMQHYIDEQLRSMIRNKNDRSIVGKFARYAEVMSFIEQVAADNQFVSTYSTGTTVENRKLQVVKIATPSAKKAIWIDCGIHAREWISPSTCVYMINQLITDYNNGVKNIVDLLNYYEFHILPLHNPDGYEYSHTTYRMWRKNRNKASSSSNCIGVDLNRNFGYKWLTGGSSTNACSDTYAGPSANSELEIQGVQSAINAKLGVWDGFFTLHTYGKWVFTLWGYTRNDPPNFADLKAKAKAGVDALVAVNNERGWTFGSSSQLLYVASGGSEDWAYGSAGIPYTYCWELRPGQSGTDSNYGFALPEDRAPKAGAETYAGIIASVQSIYDTLGPKA